MKLPLLIDAPTSVIGSPIVGLVEGSWKLEGNLIDSTYELYVISSPNDVSQLPFTSTIKGPARIRVVRMRKGSEKSITIYAKREPNGTS